MNYNNAPPPPAHNNASTRDSFQCLQIYSAFPYMSHVCRMYLSIVFFLNTLINTFAVLYSLLDRCAQILTVLYILVLMEFSSILHHMSPVDTRLVM
jgi:hypothetical protein